MAKLKAPLFSLGATQKLGDALVFFPWKGLNCVRTWVVPTNPKTTAQNTQRSYVTDSVAYIHLQMQHATHPLKTADKSAYSLWGSLWATPRTWFNQIIKMLVDSRVAGKDARLPTDGATTPGAAQLGVSVWDNSAGITVADFYWGTTKACTDGYVAGAVAAGHWTGTILLLTAGVKYYWQLRATAPAGATMIKSGVYYGTPT
jgi:hypothetical protein